jgi:uncharacterized membrane protein SpoIIM required for sporulation
MTFDVRNGSSAMITLLVVFVLMAAGIVGFIMLSTQHNETLTSDPTNSTGVLSTGSLGYNLTNQTSTVIANNGGAAIFLFFMAFVVCLSMIIIVAFKR